MYLTKLASVQLVLWNILEEYGQDPASVFKAVKLDPELMYKPGARHRLDKIAALWDEMDRRIPDPCFGLTAATNWHPSHFGILGYAMLTSSSLRTTLGRLIRFHGVISSANFGELHEDQDKGTLTFNLVYRDEKPYPRPREDAALAWILSALRINYQQDFAPIAVSLRHTRPDCSEKYAEFFQAPITFGAKDSGFVLSLEQADRFLPSGNKNLAAFNDQMMSRYLEELKDEELSHRVQKIIVELLPCGNASIEAVAEKLSLSTRSLQRALREEGTTFISLLNKTRQEIAKRYVQDMRHDLTEVAFLLGFSELSTFSRSFKRWTGQSPDQFRKAG